MRPWESVPAPGPPLAAARVGRAWAHLTAGLEDDDPDDFLAAVGHVEGAEHERDCRTLWRWPGEPVQGVGAGAKPRYDTVLKVLRRLSVKLTVSAALPCVASCRYQAGCSWRAG
jgi:hypothetical protein